MLKLTRDPHRCPRCGHTYLIRHQRPWWMKLLGVERYLRCGACRQRLLFCAPGKCNSRTPAR